MDCLKWAAKNLEKGAVKGKRVIEVGSFDVNGSLRYIVELMEPSEYIGVDIKEGPGVDIICPGENLVDQFGRESFDVVISTCVLEHTRDWRSNISNIKNICKPKGTILIIVPIDWPYHEWPFDFWRFKRKDIEEIFSDCSILTLEEDDKKPSLAYVLIRKPEQFTEIDLSGHKLFSVIVNKRVKEIQDKDFRCFHFRRLLLKNRIKNLLLSAYRKVF